MFQVKCFHIILLVCVAHGTLAELQIISRAEWKAKPAKEGMDPLQTPVDRIIIAHTVGNECKTKSICLQEILNIQNYHMNSFNFHDISYNFLVGSDGNVYEGRGSAFQGAIAKGFNAGSISIGYMGTFLTDLPSEAALNAGKALLEKLIQDQKLKSDFKLYGHRQLSPTVSPGDALYAEIQKWPKWTSEVA